MPLLAVGCGSDDDSASDGNGESPEISSEAESLCQKQCDASFSECVTDVDACLSDCREEAALNEEHCASAYAAFSACQAAKPLSAYQCLDVHASAPVSGCDDEYDALDTCLAPFH